MKITVIGRNVYESDIVLQSDYVSNYHAEIIQLDNGEMFIVDKSSNGTFVNDQRLTPGKEVPLHRGDKVFFADVPFDWTQLPQNNLPEGVKKVINIGSHYMNDVSIQGSNVSRFHASIRLMRDGKYYLYDNSKNGTSVNGKRIQKEKPFLLKSTDTISCGGVPVKNPVPKKLPWRIIGSIIAAACILIGAVFAYLRYIDKSDTQLAKMYAKSVVLMHCSYYFEVECGTLDISDLPDPDSYNERTQKFTDRMSKKFVVVDDAIVEYNGDNGHVVDATGFFIGKNGHIVTNRHVARPWETRYVSYGSGNDVSIMTAAEDFYRSKLNKLYEIGYTAALQYISQVKIKGVLENAIIVPNGEYVDIKSAYNCQELACGLNEGEDLAIFKIRSNTLPQGVTYIPINKIKAIDPVQGLPVVTIGFPFGTAMQNIQETQLQANLASGVVSSNTKNYSFGLTAVSFHGASGSPVFDRKGNLIGVLNAGIDFSQGFNFAIRSEYLLNLMSRAGLSK